MIYASVQPISADGCRQISQGHLRFSAKNSTWNINLSRSSNPQRHRWHAALFNYHLAIIYTDVVWPINNNNTIGRKAWCCCLRAVDISFKCWLYLYHQSQCSKIWDRTCLVPITQIVRVFGMNRFESLSGRDILCLKKLPTLSKEDPFVSRKLIRHESEGLKQFLSQKLRHFYKYIRSWVENEWCCLRTVDTAVEMLTLQSDKNLLKL